MFDSKNRNSEFWLYLMASVSILGAFALFSFAPFLENKEAANIIGSWWFGVLGKLFYLTAGIGLICLLYKLLTRVRSAALK
jgi:hypothetical protein